MVSSVFKLSYGAVLTLVAGLCAAQTTIPSSFPTNMAVPASYSGPYRPQVHFSPPQGFMNDPNGMFVDSNGTYHLYYQLDPNNTIAGFQHWGHATSQDLYHWENQAIAISPPGYGYGIYSGSAVTDPNNTSGFFPNQTNGVVAMYTLNNATAEVQEIAYSNDGGYTFTKYAGNPVLTHNSNQFRDPKVLWHAPTKKWVVIVSYAQDFVLGFYTSPDLKKWTHASNFSGHGLLGQQWECPNMVEIPMEGASEPMWLLYLSIQPGAPMGGSISQYYPGNFNGTHYTTVDSVARIADFGKDNYAGQFFSGIPGDQNQLSIHWASNWEYTDYVPTGPAEGWQSAMTLPRSNYLKNISRVGYDLVSAPYGLEAVTGPKLASNDSLGNGTMLVDFGSVASGAIMFEVNMTGLNGSQLTPASSLNFSISSSSSGESLTAGMSLYLQAFWMDRGNTNGFNNPFFTDKASAGIIFADNFTMQVVVDHILWEVFLFGGEQDATFSFFSEEPLDTLTIKAGGLNQGSKTSVAVYGLTSAWSSQANSSGIVEGNSTSIGGRKMMFERDLIEGISFVA